MTRRLVFAAVLATLLGAGLVGSASAHTICVVDTNPNNPGICVNWDDPK